MIDRRIQYVVATARYGSFTAAAKHVGVGQSAVTKSVADLEQELGYSIFNRMARGVLLTEEGRVFVDRAKRLLDDAQYLIRRPVDGSDPYADSLRIGVCPASLEWLLVEPLSALMARHPSIRLNIVGGTFDKVVDQLRGGAIDVALGYQAAFEDQADFRREQVHSLRTTFFVRRGHPLLDCKKVTKSDIAKYDLISPSGSVPYESFLRKIYEDSGISPNEKIHVVDYFPIVLRLVRNSDAISIASMHYARTSVFLSRFAPIPFLNTRPPAPLCAATRLRWNPRPTVRAFVRACREKLPAS